MLRIENLHVDYAQIPAVRGINMDVRAGEIVALIGANGAGKSTTLKAISGLIKPSAGTIELDGRPLVGLAPEQLRRTRNHSRAGGAEDISASDGRRKSSGGRVCGSGPRG